MRLSLLLLCTLVVLAVIASCEGKRRKKVAGPCKVKDCKKCNLTGKKCKVCITGYKPKQRGRKCGPKPCFVNPCENGGTCKYNKRKKKEVCKCTDGFSGAKCEIAAAKPEPVVDPVPVDPKPVVDPVPVDPKPVVDPVPVDPKPVVDPVPVDPNPVVEPVPVEPKPQEPAKLSEIESGVATDLWLPQSWYGHTKSLCPLITKGIAPDLKSCEALCERTPECNIINHCGEPGKYYIYNYLQMKTYWPPHAKVCNIHGHTNVCEIRSCDISKANAMNPKIPAIPLPGDNSEREEMLWDTLWPTSRWAGGGPKCCEN